jgi:phytoene dehydrogenase-like protein
MEITVPTSTIRRWRLPGQHVLSAVVQYAPYALKEGLGAGRQRFHDISSGLLERTRRACAQRRGGELLTPADIEREFRISGGHWHHAELAFDQFLMVRPVPGAAQYRTPVPGFVPVRRRLSSGRRRDGRCRAQCRAPGTDEGAAPEKGIMTDAA